MNILHETQVIVIGAGVIGCSIAYHLGVRGMDVAVLDSGNICSGASSANLGLVWVQEKEPSSYMELNMMGVQMHSKMAPKYDEDVGFRMPGGIVLCLTDKDLERSMKTYERLKKDSKSYMACFLNPREVRELEPYVSNKIVGGFYSPHDGHIDPLRLTHQLAVLAKRAGVRFILETKAINILNKDGMVTGLHTGAGDIVAKNVVIAAGTGSSSLANPLGINLPLRFDRGQILVTGAIKQILHHPTEDIRQTVNGNILMGTTHEEAGLDNSTTTDAAVRIATNALNSIPILKDVPILRQFSGIRPMPIDKRPFLGSVKSMEGLYIAVSHSGITLSILHGKVISDLVVDGMTDIPISDYDPERFSKEHSPIDRNNKR
jgi:glycine/D-amino acid oxidase-like deaminating enzyme